MLSTFASLSISFRYSGKIKTLRTLQDEANPTKSLPRRQAGRKAGRKIILLLILGLVVGCAQTSVIKGKISKIDAEHNLVTLNVGKDKDVSLGIVFTVHRGNKWLGVIRIDNVGENWATGMVIGKRWWIERMQVGDEVTTKKW